MRVIDAKKETWSLQPVGQGCNVKINRVDNGIEYHHLPVLVKLNEDQLIHVDPSTRKATLMRSSIKRSVKTGHSNELLINFLSYLGGSNVMSNTDKVKQFVNYYKTNFDNGNFKSPEVTLTRTGDYYADENNIIISK